MARRDYSFPFRIDGGSRQGALASYPDHVAQMIRQVLLTAPGERVCLPEFGCGLRQLLFAPNSEPLNASVQLLVRQALTRWLSGHIELRQVEVLPPDAGNEDRVRLRIDYLLLETREARQLDVQVL